MERFLNVDRTDLAFPIPHVSMLGSPSHLFYKVIALFAIANADAAVPTFDCGDYNNDCVGCVQMAVNLVSQCSFCPKDGMCHTVGSVFNKCSSDECIRVSEMSQCKNKDIHACDDVINKSYADMGMKNSTKPAVTPSGFESRYRKPLTSTCTGPHESCCPAPMDDVHNCPDSARTSDCDAKKSCCCA